MGTRDERMLQRYRARKVSQLLAGGQLPIEDLDDRGASQGPTSRSEYDSTSLNEEIESGPLSQPPMQLHEEGRR